MARTSVAWATTALVLAGCAPAGVGQPEPRSGAAGIPVAVDSGVGAGPGQSDWPAPADPWAAPGWAAAAGEDWPEELARELVPSGLRLVGGSAQAGLAVDGTGDVWVDGAWLVARVDPRSGASDVWDASDDLSFGRVRQVVGSTGPGVWLVEDDRVGLFDGQRFQVDLEVPAEYRGGGRISAMAQRGSEVWVASAAGVARWSDGAWTMVGLGELADVVALAVDREGAVWASGRVSSGATRRWTVVRFDGERWQAPGTSEAFAVVEIAADPTGGVVARAESFGASVLRHDGADWVSLDEDRPRIGTLVDSALAVTSKGDIWVAGSTGVAVRPTLGRWRTSVDSRGAGQRVLEAATAIAVSGRIVVVADRDGLVRVDSGPPERIWRAPGIRGDAAALAEPLPGAAALTAVSTTRAWVQPYGWYRSTTTRYTDGTWSVVNPPDEAWWNGLFAGIPTLGPDGRIWAISAAGLARTDADADAWQVVGPEVRPGRDWTDPIPELVPGRSPALWLRQPDERRPGPGWSLRRIDPAGSVTEVPGPDPALVADDRSAPELAEPDGPTTLAAAPDGSVWVVQPAQGGAPGMRLVVLRWDDRWRRVAEIAAPGGWVDGVVATADGALWVVLRSGEDGLSQVVRLDRAGRAVIPVRVRGLRALGDDVCGVDARATWGPPVFGPSDLGEVLCITGSTLTTRRLLDLPIRALDVAPDGSMWVLGEQLALVGESPG